MLKVLSKLIKQTELTDSNTLGIYSSANTICAHFVAIIIIIIIMKLTVSRAKHVIQVKTDNKK